MIKKLFRLLPPKIRVLIANVLLVVIKPFLANNNIFKLYIRIKHAIGWYRVIKKGDIVIQGGVDYTFPPSFVEPMSEAVGKNGLVIGIEPSIENINIVKYKIENNQLHNNIILIHKAISNQKGKMNLVIGKKGTWNRLDDRQQKSWKKENTFTKKEVEVEIDTIDNILSELKIDMKKIKFVSLTINGQEYKGLKGMTKLMQSSPNLSINVVAGREKAFPEIGLINGKPDHEVINNYLFELGFETKYHELQPGKMGYVMAKKGKAKFFIN